MRVPSWRRYLRFWRPDVAADVDDELRFHFEEHTAALRALGLGAAEARARAREEFGDVDAVRAALREIGERRERRAARATWWEALAYDARYAVRAIRRAPGVAAAVVVTLALGLGANAAIFSLLDRVYLQLPERVADARGVHRLYARRQMVGGPATLPSFSYPELADLRAGLAGRARLAAYKSTSQVRLGREDDAPRLNVAYAEGDYFALLGVHPALGRFFAPAEDRIDGAARVAVLSHALWRARFGGDSSVVGRTIELERERYVVVGVAAEGFAGADLDATDVWVPLGALPFYREHGAHGAMARRLIVLRVLGRYARDADERALLARATAAYRHGDAANEAPGDTGDTTATILAGPITEALGPGETRQEMSIATRLGAVALLVLLIACANVANLLLARAVQRRREIAVRLALGVSRRRLLRQMLTEGVVLAAAAGLAALALGVWGGAALRAALMPHTHWADGAFEARLPLFTGALAVLVGLLSALAPALTASRSDVSAHLKAGAREGSRSHARLRSVLVVVQAALSVALLAGAGLFVRSLRSVQAIDVGYDVDRLVFADVNVPAIPADSGRGAPLLPRLEEARARLAAMPGVERAALATIEPMWGFSFYTLFQPGRDSVPRLDGDYATFTGVSPEYFVTVGLRVRRGRAFTRADRAGAPRVVIVNETMARTFWPQADALGQCVILETRTNPCSTVVGVVANAHRGDVIESPKMLYYLPLAQFPDELRGGGVVALRVRPEMASLAGERARRELRRLFPEADPPRAVAMAELLAPHLRPWRLGAQLFSVLGLLALAVAVAGIYGTVAYGVSQRTHEMGVRVALGARAADVLRLVVGEGVRVVAVGVALGIALALVMGRVIASLLYATSPRDPIVLGAVALALLAAAAAASLLPAWRAARVDPATALRAE